MVRYILSESGFSGAIDTVHGRHQSSHDAGLRRTVMLTEKEQEGKRLDFVKATKQKRGRLYTLIEQEMEQERKRLEHEQEQERKRLEHEQEQERKRLDFVKATKQNNFRSICPEPIFTVYIMWTELGQNPKQKILEQEQEQERKRLEYIYNQIHIQKLELLQFKILFLVLPNTILDYILSDNKCRKYPCIDSILYLLWQSGNVELNPGPARSIKYRNWLYDTCSKVRKSIVEIPVAKNIWKKKPTNWPSEEKYGNPRMVEMQEVYEFLGTLLKYCEDNYIKLDQNIHTEVKLWQEDHIDEMLHLHLIRTCLENISSEVSSLPSRCNRLQVGGRVFEITFAANSVDMQEQHSGLYRSEATRKLASILIKLYYEKNPQKKLDNIWIVKPAEWSDSVRFFDPFNGGQRETDREDEKLVYELLKCCDIKANIQKKAIIPDLYQPLIDAWKARDTNQVTKFLNEIVVPKKIQNALEALDEELLLYDPKVTDELLKMGVHISLANNKRKLEVASNEGKRKRLDAVLSSASADELRDDIFIAQVATPDSTQDVNQDVTEKNKEAFEAIMNALGKDPSSCFTDIFLDDFSN